MTLKEVYDYGTEQLKEAGIEYPSVDAFYLLEFAAGIDKTKYLRYKDYPVQEEYFNQYKELIEKRKTRIPYQYITGRADFGGLTFEVNESVLIPRLDTEVLLEQVLRLIPFQANVLDMCTGSGCLGIAIKRHRPDARVTLADISEDALKIAELNLKHNYLEAASKADSDLRVRVVKTDLFKKLTGEKYKIIVSNPPYVTEAEYETLAPEVKDHEPKLALTAGEDGLDIYRRLIKEAPRYLEKEGSLALEIGCSQAEAVTGLMESAGFTNIRVIKDLAGLDRVVIGQMGE
ncbi:MAG: peptide chain release factor N(5)-glutamine methyltransferase, partial [Parasporobacterium sp.]|nr:peptide chain release factor N(5)-glutamine methyltransferase [Parasporobacterium sp.]